MRAGVAGRGASGRCRASRSTWFAKTAGMAESLHCHVEIRDALTRQPLAAVETSPAYELAEGISALDMEAVWPCPSWRMSYCLTLA